MKFRYLSILPLLILFACQSSPHQIEEGYWTGTLTPMNHPDMSNPMGYEVSYSEGALKIDVIGPDSTAIPASNVLLRNDTLYFQFNEPEEQVTLDCALAEHETAEQGFAGRCTDESGKWARFTMIPPNQ